MPKTTFLLYLDDDLLQQVRQAAQADMPAGAEKPNVNQWVRAAILEKLARAAKKPLEKL